LWFYVEIGLSDTLFCYLFIIISRYFIFYIRSEYCTSLVTATSLDGHLLLCGRHWSLRFSINIYFFCWLVNSLHCLKLLHRFILISWLLRIYTFSVLAYLWNHIRSLFHIVGLRHWIYILSLNLHKCWWETAQTKSLITYTFHIRKERHTWILGRGIIIWNKKYLPGKSSFGLPFFLAIYKL
jgi:hypothetical protein